MVSCHSLLISKINLISEKVFGDAGFLYKVLPASFFFKNTQPIFIGSHDFLSPLKFFILKIKPRESNKKNKNNKNQFYHIFFIVSIFHFKHSLISKYIRIFMISYLNQNKRISVLLLTIVIL